MSVYPTWLAGQRVTAANLTSMQRHVIVALATQSVTNSATLVSDNELTFPLAANAVYLVEFSLLFNSTSATGDVKVQWSVPSGTTGLRHVIGPTNNSATFTNRQDTAVRVAAHAFTTNGVSQLEAGGAATDTLVYERAVVTTSSTPGNVTVQWAQNAATAAVTLTRDANSFMTVQRVG
ncbi:MAG: hypothetical protein ACRDQ2_11885 [Gaiellales bacterium]